MPQAVSGDQQVLVGEQALKYAIVPTDDSLGFNWRSADRPFGSSGLVFPDEVGWVMTNRQPTARTSGSIFKAP